MPSCSVPTCKNAAIYRVILYQFCPDTGGIVYEHDTICPFICAPHAIANEQSAQGKAEYKVMGSGVRYTYTNKAHIDGFALYMPLDYCDSLHELPPKVQEDMHTKIGAYCQAQTADKQDIGHIYTYMLEGNRVTIIISEPSDYPFTETTLRRTNYLAQLRFEQQGSWCISDTGDLINDRDVWVPHQPKKRAWMLYWHRYTDEWIRMDEATHGDINYWLAAIEEDRWGVFYG